MKENNLYPNETTVCEETGDTSNRKETMMNDDEAITIRIRASEIVNALKQAADQNKEKGSDSE